MDVIVFDDRNDMRFGRLSIVEKAAFQEPVFEKSAI